MAEERHRDKQVKIWVTEQERKELKRRARKLGMSVSDCVRLLLIHSDDLSVNVIDTSALKKTFFELHKHGVNLNQLMRFLNTYGPEEFDKRRVAAALEKEIAVFSQTHAALESLEDEARRHNVFISLEEPDGDAGSGGTE